MSWNVWGFLPRSCLCTEEWETRVEVGLGLEKMNLAIWWVWEMTPDTRCHYTPSLKTAKQPRSCQRIFPSDMSAICWLGSILPSFLLQSWLRNSTYTRDSKVCWTLGWLPGNPGSMPPSSMIEEPAFWALGKVKTLSQGLQICTNVVINFDLIRERKGLGKLDTIHPLWWFG